MEVTGSRNASDYDLYAQWIDDKVIHKIIKINSVLSFDLSTVQKKPHWVEVAAEGQYRVEPAKIKKFKVTNKWALL